MLETKQSVAQTVCDNNRLETQEWLAALEGLVHFADLERAAFVMQCLVAMADRLCVLDTMTLAGSFTNTCDDNVPGLPKWTAADQAASNWVRWHAMAMVVRTNRTASELGGHIATYASQAYLMDVGMHYFFKGRNSQHKEDLIFYQGHASPGIYARALLEGRLTADQIMHFRQETEGKGVSSYPHPWLMPSFWQFPTVSMGIGPLCAVYQARFMKYMQDRGLIADQNRKVWAFCGDGEMDEPESTSGIALAAREKLDNLIFVINCNLQRLDGPVRGNDNIIAELESRFRGAGWRVIKVLWNSAWDALFAQDKHGLLARTLAALPDGEYQNLATKGSAYWREQFFAQHPDLEAMIANWSDAQLRQLGFGGHDPQKIIAAYHAAVHTKGRPVLILPKTVKGYGMGPLGEAANPTHQQKKLPGEDLVGFVKRFNLPITAEQAADAALVMPEEGDAGLQRIRAVRAPLGGEIPQRDGRCAPLKIPALSSFSALLEGTGKREISTTMAFVRLLGVLLRDANIKDRVVPILADESRTFGMEGLFRQIGIYSPQGQRYEPIDRQQMMYYKESKTGQLLQEGINEAGAIASWMAAASSYSCHGEAMIPFYIYYSMFGIQRVGDFMWAAGDQRCRGFLLGATSGRTTLAGEGLQHNDGHSQLWTNNIPNCISYDPTYAYELAVIMQHGMQEMYVDQKDVYYYITLTNDNIAHPAMPEGVEEGIIRGMYRLQAATIPSDQPVSLLGCGAILPEVVKAAAMLADRYQVAAEVWSVPSFNLLRRDAQAWQRRCLLSPEDDHGQSYIAECLGQSTAPVIAATDYVKLFAEQVSPFISRPYEVLGTDGFSRSDTRAKLRQHFEVNSAYVVYATLVSLARTGDVAWSVVRQAQQDLNIQVEKTDPMFT